MLSLYKLELFDTVAAEGSFSKAAERMSLTQPAVSQHIRDLEASLGAELFRRDYRGVTLTPAGETLLDYTRCILRLVADAEAAVANLESLSTGKLHIGATPGAGVYLLPEWIPSFNARYPQLSVSLRTDTTDVIASELLAQHLDLGFVEGEIEIHLPLTAMVLREIQLYVVVGREHTWWERSSISISQLDGHPFITRTLGSHTRAWVDRLLEKYGVRPQIIADFDNPDAIRTAVASGAGVTILPDWSVQDVEGERFRLLAIEEEDLKRTLKLVWNEETPMQPVSRAFLSQLAERFPQLTRIVASGSGVDIRIPAREEYRASLQCVQEQRR